MKFFNQLSLIINDLLKYSKVFGILVLAVLLLILKSLFSDFEIFCNLLMVLLCLTYFFLCRHYTHPPDPVTMAVGLVLVLILVMLSVNTMKKKSLTDRMSIIVYLLLLFSLIISLLGNYFGVPI